MLDRRKGITFRRGPHGNPKTTSGWYSDNGLLPVNSQVRDHKRGRVFTPTSRCFSTGALRTVVFVQSLRQLLQSASKSVVRLINVNSSTRERSIYIVWTRSAKFTWSPQPSSQQSFCHRLRLVVCSCICCQHIPDTLKVDSACELRRPAPQLSSKVAAGLPLQGVTLQDLGGVNRRANRWGVLGFGLRSRPTDPLKNGAVPVVRVVLLKRRRLVQVCKEGRQPNCW